MPYLQYLITPVIAALVGYSTNWIAIKMLFWPHTEKRIGRFRLPLTPGMIPKERERLTKKISETVSASILTPEVLAKELSSNSLWSSVGETNELSEITIGDLLKKLGIDDLPGYAGRLILNALKDERVQETIMALASDVLRGLLRDAGGLKTLRDYIVAKGDAFIESEAFDIWLEDRLADLRQQVFDENATVDRFIPEAVMVSVQNIIEEWMPRVVTYVKQWPEENPWLDEKLSATVREIIDVNFGRLIGLFIDHKKIYANIKEGLFTYLSDPENQQFMLTKVNEAINAFYTGPCARWENKLPDDTLITEKVKAWLRKESLAVKIDPLINATGIRLDEWMENSFPAFEEKLAVFLRERLQNIEWPENTSSQAFEGAFKILALPLQSLCDLRLGDLMGYLNTHEKKAAIGQTFKEMAAFIAKHMQVAKMIENKLNAFAIAEVEDLILSVVKRELNVITALGGLLGFFIGLLSLVPELFR